MSNDFIKKNYHIIIYTICYLSLLIGFILGENVTSGPKNDFLHTWNGSMEFNNNFLFSLLNFENIQNQTRISPVYLILISFLNDIFKSFDLTRFFLFFIISLSQVVYYKILKIIYYPNIIKEKKVLFILSCVIFISPSFRANVIWPESAMLGLLLFLIGLYFFLKSRVCLKKKYIYLNIVFVALAAYIRPSFALFSIFFFIYFSLQAKSLKTIISIILLNIILAAPALYYVFILEIHFFNLGVKNTGLNLNYLNKISVIFSIITFHLIPILFYKNFFVERYFFKKNLKLILITIPISYIFFIYFNYDLEITGGGIFLHLSDFIFNNYYMFYLMIPFFIFFLLRLCMIDLKKNIFVLIIIIISIPQFTVYHKYFDPLILILSLTLFNFGITKDFFKEKNLIFVFSFYGVYYFINFFNHNLIN